MKNDYLLPIIKTSGLYRVDRQGRVWTRKKKGGQVPYKNKWRRICQGAGSGGRQQVRHNGKMVYRSRLVWFWFKGTIGHRFDIDHKNNNKRDDRLRNLQRLTHKQNQRKAERDGLLRASRVPTTQRKLGAKKFWCDPKRHKHMSIVTRTNWQHPQIRAKMIRAQRCRRRREKEEQHADK